MVKNKIQLTVLRFLNAACNVVDAVAYRPAVVKLTLRIPHWWSCQLARLSVLLDERWGAGYWESENSPPMPNGLCDCCGRRAAWQYAGDYANDPEFADSDISANDYLAWHRVRLCTWCYPDLADINNQDDLEERFSVARDLSISWKWRWRVPG